MLIHELRQLRRAEKFFNRRDDRANVNQILRRDDIGVLRSHAFAHDAFHAAHADTELVLQKFADRTHAPIAEVVDIVHGAGFRIQRENIINRAYDIGDAECAVIFNRQRGRTKHGIVAEFGFDANRNRLTIAAANFVGFQTENFCFAFVGNFVKHCLRNNFIGGQKDFARSHVE